RNGFSEYYEVSAQPGIFVDDARTGGDRVFVRGSDHGRDQGHAGDVRARAIRVLRGALLSDSLSERVAGRHPGIWRPADDDYLSVLSERIWDRAPWRLCRLGVRGGPAVSVLPVGGGSEGAAA